MSAQVIVHPDADLLAQGVAARLLTRLIDLQSVQKEVHVALTGGTLGISLLAAAREMTLRAAVDWSVVHLWWGDERFVASQDGDRNELQAREALLDELSDASGGPLPEANIHPMPAAAPGVSVEDGAIAYAHTLATFAADKPGSVGTCRAGAAEDGGTAGVCRPEASGGPAVPRFDIVLLGMGPDGHVASLFPGHPALQAKGATVAVNGSPKPPPQRISLTFDALRQAREVWLVVAGEGKAAAVARGMSGDELGTTPAAGARGTGRTLWLLDTAAASQLASSVS